MAPTLPPPRTMAAVVSGVTETMLGLTFRAVDEEVPWDHLVWRAAVLPIPGSFPLTVGLSSDRAGCEALSAKMFQLPAHELSDDMLSDSLCELVNMTAGLLKSELRLEQKLGLPRIVPANQPPVSPAQLDRSRIVLQADRLGLVLWVFPGLA